MQEYMTRWNGSNIPLYVRNVSIFGIYYPQVSATDPQGPERQLYSLAWPWDMANMETLAKGSVNDSELILRVQGSH